MSRLRRFLTALGVAAMVGLRDATGLAPPPPRLFTEQIEWLSPEPEDDGEPEAVLREPDPYVPRPTSAKRPSFGPVGVREAGAAALGGWTLVCAFLLMPSGLMSLVALFLPHLRNAAGIHGFALVLLALTAVGNLGGACLVFRRSRVAPAFFTLYLPVMLFMNLLLPDLLGTMNRRLAAFGSAPDLEWGGLAAVMAVNAVVVLAMVLYWGRSRRVESVFGSRGLAILSWASGG